MLIKIIVILMLIAILISLGRALFFLMRGGHPGSTDMVKSLTIRIGLSLILFILLVIAFAIGWMQPHGINLAKTAITKS